MAVNKAIQAAVLNAMGGSSGLPAATINWDFTTLAGFNASGVAFTRSTPSTYITNGVVSALASGAPAIESWNGKNKGLRLNPAGTNLLNYSNTFSNSTYWSAVASTRGTGNLGPDGVTNMGLFTEDTTTNYHGCQQTIASVTVGTTHTFSIFVRRPAGNTRITAVIRMGNQFASVWTDMVVRFDGIFGYWLFADPTNQTNVSGRVDDLGNGVMLVSITGTWATAGTKSFLTFESSGGRSAFAGNTSLGLEVWGAQVTATNGPIAYIDNPTTTHNSVAAESAIVASPAWLNTTQGTFVIEHDMQSGTLIGSGTNVILSATIPGKTAIAYDATGTDIVSNGGAAINSGAALGFGSDIRFLGTSTAQFSGHIKNVKYYPSRLTPTQLQTLTNTVSTSAPGTWRIASTRARLPTNLEALTGTRLMAVSRVSTPIAGSFSKLRAVFANWMFPGTDNANAVTIDELWLERIGAVNESVQVKFGGSNSLTLNIGDIKVVSDDILPSSFTSLTAFVTGDYRWRCRWHVASTGQTFPVSRWPLDPTGVQGFSYDPAVTSPDQAMSSTGGLSFTGAHSAPVRVLAPYMSGIPSSGDAVTWFVVGDSLIEGTNNISGYTYVEKAAVALGVPCLVYCQGGSHQQLITSTQSIKDHWYPHFAEARVLIDGMGTNLSSNIYSFLDYWQYAKNTFHYDKIVHLGLWPNTSAASFVPASITNSGTTATVTVTGSGGTVPPVGASIAISGVTPSAYNTPASPTITLVTAATGVGTTTGTFSYVCTSTPSGSATVMGTWRDLSETSEANQQVLRTFPQDIDTAWAYFAKTGQIDLNHKLTSMTGTNTDKWLISPVGTVGVGTVEGTHPFAAADDLAAAEVQPLLAALPITL